MTKLKRCPFCGELPEIYPKDPEKEGNAWAKVSCVNPNCAASPEIQDGCNIINTSTNYKKEAVKAWNHRVNKEAEFLEKLKASLGDYIKKHTYVEGTYNHGLYYGYYNIFDWIEEFQNENI